MMYTDTFYLFMCMIFSISHSEYGGLRDTAATMGVGNTIERKLARIERNELVPTVTQ